MDVLKVLFQKNLNFGQNVSCLLKTTNHFLRIILKSRYSLVEENYKKKIKIVSL